MGIKIMVCFRDVLDFYFTPKTRVSWRGPYMNRFIANFYIIESFPFRGGSKRFEQKYGRWPQTVWLENVNCTGTESSLEQCYTSIDWTPKSCSHFLDVAVSCKFPSVKPGICILLN